MNEYRRFVQNEIDQRGWTQSDVEKHGGPTRQVVHKILTDQRKVLDYRPKQDTVEKLATAFGVSVDVVLAHVAMAMELPVSIEMASLDDVSDGDLLDQIRKRMQRGSSQHADDNTTSTDPVDLRPVGEDPDTEDVGSEQKTLLQQDDFDLAAHPDMRLAADGEDEYFDSLGEESQETHSPNQEDN